MRYSNTYLDRKKEIFDKVRKNLKEIKNIIYKNHWLSRKNRNMLKG